MSCQMFEEFSARSDFLVILPFTRDLGTSANLSRGGTKYLLSMSELTHLQQLCERTQFCKVLVYDLHVGKTLTLRLHCVLGIRLCFP